jgi:hypothetical protein
MLGGGKPTLKEETSMRFYTQQHRYYCGVDLHARSLYVCVLDHIDAATTSLSSLIRKRAH